MQSYHCQAILIWPDGPFKNGYFVDIFKFKICKKDAAGDRPLANGHDWGVAVDEEWIYLADGHDWGELGVLCIE